MKMTVAAPGGDGRGDVGERLVARRVAAAEAVGRCDDLVAQPLQARATRLVVVRDQVPVAREAGHRRDLMEDVRLLERHRAADPGRRADRQVRLVVEERAGAERAGVEVGRAGDDLHPVGQSQGARHLGEHGAHHGAGGAQRRQVVEAHARAAHQLGVVLEALEISVVGEPRAGHRRVRRGGDAREPHREVVDRLEEPARRPGDLRLVVEEMEHVPDRVGAGGRRRARGAPNPHGQRHGRVAAQRPADDPLRVRRAPAVHPEAALADRDPALVDGNRARPLTRAAHCLDPVRLDHAGRHRAAGCVRDQVPPDGRVLHRATAREQSGLDRAVVVPGDLPRQRDEPDLRPTRTEVDREDKALLAVSRVRAGRDVGGGFGQLFGRTVSWLSIMSAMTALMNSSASSVNPPTTPP